MWELWERVLRAIARKAGSYSAVSCGSASYALSPARRAPTVSYRPRGSLLQQVLCGQHFLVDGDISAGSECLHKRDKISDA